MLLLPAAIVRCKAVSLLLLPAAIVRCKAVSLLLLPVAFGRCKAVICCCYLRLSFVVGGDSVVATCGYRSL